MAGAQLPDRLIDALDLGVERGPAEGGIGIVCAACRPARRERSIDGHAEGAPSRTAGPAMSVPDLGTGAVSEVLTAVGR